MLSRHTNSRKGISNLGIGISFLVVGLLFFFGGSLGMVFSEATDGLTEGMLASGTQKSTALGNSFTAFFTSRNSLFTENKKLTESLSLFETMKLENVRLTEENEKLKNILGRTNTSQAILAGVVGKPNRSPYDSLIVDVGREEGILGGEKILLHEGRLVIGEITEVYSHTSRGTLYSSPGIATEAFLGDSRTPVTLTGRGGGNFQTELPRGVTVVKDAVVTTGGVFPKIIGRVTEVFLDPREPFQGILITSPFNIMELSWVEIMKSE